MLLFWGYIIFLSGGLFSGEMKTVIFILLPGFLAVFSLNAFSAPSLDIRSEPVLNNGYTGPANNPSASMGQWFLNLETAGIESRTHEFYDIPSTGNDGTLSIKGIVTDLLKGG